MPSLPGDAILFLILAVAAGDPPCGTGHNEHDLPIVGATMSSQQNQRAAENCIDCVTADDSNSALCHTTDATEVSPWLCIELEEEAAIASVRIWNRVGTYGERLNNGGFEVWASACEWSDGESDECPRERCAQLSGLSSSAEYVECHATNRRAAALAHSPHEL